MTPIEIIAAILAIVILLKLIFLNVVKNELMVKIIKKMFAIKLLVPAISVSLAGVILYFLLQELNAAQIFATTLFGILVYSLALVMYPGIFSAFMEDILSNKKKLWLAQLVWFALSVWVLYSLFAK